MNKIKLQMEMNNKKLMKKNKIKMLPLDWAEILKKTNANL